LWADRDDHQNANQVGNGRYLLRFESLSKTNVGPLYVTAHNGWSGILVTGSDSNGPGLVFNGARFEGYAEQPLPLCPSRQLSPWVVVFESTE
jgi:hypothetical protein